jgi:fluoride exporter
MGMGVGIAVAGALGALARFGLDGLITRKAGGGFPWGTLVVNVTGAFLLGFLITLLTERFQVQPWVRQSLTVGFLGAYTTFSTLSFDTYRLFEQGDVWLAVANGLGSLAAGLVAVALGVVLARAV